MLNFFIVLLVCQLVGEILVVATGGPLPGPVIGMALLFCGLLVAGHIPTPLEKMVNDWYCADSLVLQCQIFLLHDLSILA